jgi:hypothetical protein
MFRIFVLALLSCFLSSVHASFVDIKIMSLNTWGMPQFLGSLYKSERMAAIANEISKGDFDLYLLQELWMESDHNKIAASIPKDFSMTGFRQFSSHLDGYSKCDGVLGPEGCSGLAIVSRYPFKEVEFNGFSDHGDGAKIFIDGEVLARKGAGRVRIEPIPNTSIDVFTTHTIADPDACHGYNNSFYRKKQIHQLMDVWLPKSNADLVVLGGDFKATPEKSINSVYEMVRSKMKNSVEEMYSKMNHWLYDEFTTYGNPSNTFDGGKYKPSMFDYVFWRINQPEKIHASTSSFKLPLFKTTVLKFGEFHQILNDHFKLKYRTSKCVKNAYNMNREKRKYDGEAQNDIGKLWLSLFKLERKTISFSDHEAITSTISICN